ncbi:MAG: hypothetical protein ABIR63_03765 [Sphingomicrobium sp.]
MRIMILLAAAPLLLAAAPAPARTPVPPREIVNELQRALDDPRNEQKMSAMIGALSDAFLDLRVGEIAAAADGRPVTAADRTLTVRDIARRDDPQFEARLRGRVGNALPAVRQGMKSLSAALPALVRSFEEAGAAIERATANLPDPTYPRR